jgi:hypothetical protein
MTPRDLLPTSYLLLGPPDLLHDLQREFADVGWEVSVVRWQAVVTAPPADAAAPAPDWPAEVTLAGVTRDDHRAACAGYLGGGPAAGS